MDLRGELQDGGAEGPLRPPALLSAFLLPGRPHLHLAHPPPICTISSLPLLPRFKLRGSAAPPSWEEGEGLACETGGGQTRIMEVGVEGSSLVRDGGGDVRVWVKVSLQIS